MWAMTNGWTVPSEDDICQMVEDTEEVVAGFISRLEDRAGIIVSEIWVSSDDDDNTIIGIAWE